MSFFWPSKRNEPADAGIRLGRVLHWIGCGFATALLVGGAVGSVQLHNSGDDEAWILFALAGGASALVYLLGRGLRYVLSGE